MDCKLFTPLLSSTLLKGGFMLLLLLFVSLLGKTQIKVVGTVSDSVNKPIQDAYVSIYTLTSGAGISFSTTDSNGRFSLAIKKPIKESDVGIKISCVGYITKQIFPISFDKEFSITLINDVKTLQPAEVKGNVKPINLQGDTINYQVQQFTTQNDRVIGDVLKKIPGIEINELGKITYQGKAISNLFVDGDNMLDKRYNIITGNVPVDLVDKIQILENNQPIKILQGIVNNDQAAINLVLKKSALKNINTATIGVGNRTNYFLSGTNIFFKQNFKSINLLKANSEGLLLSNEVLDFGSIEDQFKTQNNIEGILLSLPFINMPPLNQRLINRSKSNLIATTFFKRINQNVTERLNIFYNNDFNDKTSWRKTALYFPIDTIKIIENQTLTEKTNNLIFSNEFNINKTSIYFTNTTNFNLQTQHNQTSLFTTNSIFQTYENSLPVFSNNLHLIVKLRRQNYFELFSYVYIQKPTETLEISPGLYRSIIDSIRPYSKIIEETKLPTFAFDNYTQFKKKINKATFSVRVGITNLRNYLQSTLSTEDSIGRKFYSGNRFLNEIRMNQIRGYASPNLSFETEKILVKFSSDFIFVPIHYKDTSQQLQKNINNLLYSPNVYFRKKIGQFNSLTFSYNYNNQFGNITDIYRGLILTNYRSFTNNLSELNEMNRHNISIRLNIKNPLKALFFYTYLNYINTTNSNLTKSEINNNITVSKNVALQNSNPSYLISTNLSKYIFPIKTTLKLSHAYNLIKLIQYQNNLLQSFQSKTSLFTIGLNKAFQKFAVFKYDFSWLLNESNTQGTPSLTTVTMKHKTEIDIFVSKSLSIINKGEYINNNAGANNNNAFFFGESAISFKPQKPSVEFVFECLNLFNQNQFTTVISSNNLLVINQLQLRPRTFLLKSTFRF